MKLYALILAVAIALGACATLRDIGNTLNDAAEIACTVFGDENPTELKELAMSVLPPAAMSEAEAAQFSPAVLCRLREIADIFLAEQRKLQHATVNGVRSGAYKAE